MEEAKPLSKNEQKRQLKAAQKAKEKEEKEALKAAEAASKGESSKKVDKPNEEDISPNEYFKIRSAAVEDLKKGSSHPYPHKFHVNISLTEFIETYNSMGDGETKEDGKKYDNSISLLSKYYYCEQTRLYR